jgi:hypothetical protein
MATTLEDVTTGIKNRLATISGLRANAVEPASPNPPAAWPFLRQPAAEYNTDFDGSMTWHFSVYIVVGTASDQYAQTNLMPYLAPTGTKSIKAALEGGVLVDSGGNRVADYATVASIESVGSYEIAGTRLIGAVLVCDVVTS